MTKLKSQTKMTKSVSQKMTISNLECCKGALFRWLPTQDKISGEKNISRVMKLEKRDFTGVAW